MAKLSADQLEDVKEAPEQLDRNKDSEITENKPCKTVKQKTIQTEIDTNLKDMDID